MSWPKTFFHTISKEHHITDFHIYWRAKYGNVYHETTTLQREKYIATIQTYHIFRRQRETHRIDPILPVSLIVSDFSWILFSFFCWLFSTFVIFSGKIKKNFPIFTQHDRKLEKHQLRITVRVIFNALYLPFLNYPGCSWSISKILTVLKLSKFQVCRITYLCFSMPPKASTNWIYPKPMTIPFFY